MESRTWALQEGFRRWEGDLGNAGRKSERFSAGRLNEAFAVDPVQSMLLKSKVRTTLYKSQTPHKRQASAASKRCKPKCEPLVLRRKAGWPENPEALRRTVTCAVAIVAN
jgi:hypothetical protein